MFAVTRRDIISFLAGAAATSVCVGVLFLIPRPTSEVVEENEQREVSDAYTYVSPLLSCGVESNPQTVQQIEDTKSSVEDVLSAAKDSGEIYEGGVYFRALNDGAWFGINHDTEFTPGSLLKVPLAMSLMKKREEDPTFLRERIANPGDITPLSQVFPPKEHVEKEKDYTFDELLRYSLVFSDNEATEMLAQQLDRETLDAAYLDLGIEKPTANGYTMSVRTYASFFRILYNGTYIGPADSNRLLTLLTQSSFAEGLRAGVPKEVAVAHKFGERTNVIDQYQQLHDCGIVYHPQQPYVLCVMLRGEAISLLPKIIAHISEVVYSGINAQGE